VKFKDEFLNAQKEAQEQNRGLWNLCKKVIIVSPKIHDIVPV
jgi:endonuclease YncB( thermonuclease family)